MVLLLAVHDGAGHPLPRLRPASSPPAPPPPPPSPVLQPRERENGDGRRNDGWVRLLLVSSRSLRVAAALPAPRACAVACCAALPGALSSPDQTLPAPLSIIAGFNGNACCRRCWCLAALGHLPSCIPAPGPCLPAARWRMLWMGMAWRTKRRRLWRRCGTLGTVLLFEPGGGGGGCAQAGGGGRIQGSKCPGGKSKMGVLCGCERQARAVGGRAAGCGGRRMTREKHANGTGTSQAWGGGMQS